MASNVVNYVESIAEAVDHVRQVLPVQGDEEAIALFSRIAEVARSANLTDDEWPRWFDSILLRLETELL